MRYCESCGVAVYGGCRFSSSLEQPVKNKTPNKRQQIWEMESLCMSEDKQDSLIIKAMLFQLEILIIERSQQLLFTEFEAC